MCIYAILTTGKSNRFQITQRDQLQSLVWFYCNAAELCMKDTIHTISYTEPWYYWSVSYNYFSKFIHCVKATLSLVCYANAAELCIKATTTYTEPFFYWNVCIQFDVYSCVLGLVSMTIRCFIETVIVRLIPSKWGTGVYILFQQILSLFVNKHRSPLP